MRHNKNLSDVARIVDLEPERIAAYLEQTGWHFYAQNRQGDRVYGLDGDLLPYVLVDKDSDTWLTATTELIQKVAKKENRSVEDVIKAIMKTMTKEDWDIWTEENKERIQEFTDGICEAFHKVEYPEMQYPYINN